MRQPVRRGGHDLRQWPGHRRAAGYSGKRRRSRPCRPFRPRTFASPPRARQGGRPPVCPPRGGAVQVHVIVLNEAGEKADSVRAHLAGELDFAEFLRTRELQRRSAGRPVSSRVWPPTSQATRTIEMRSPHGSGSARASAAATARQFSGAPGVNRAFNVRPPVTSFSQSFTGAAGAIGGPARAPAQEVQRRSASTRPAPLRRNRRRRSPARAEIEPRPRRRGADENLEAAAQARRGFPAADCPASAGARPFSRSLAATLS